MKMARNAARPRRYRAATARAAATVKDVARLAGVSAITVSRALNRPDAVSPDTLQSVRRAIARTGYVPNLLAGGLRSAQSKLVAAVVPTVAGPVFLDTIQALTDALDERGYQLMLGQSGYRNSREDALLDAIIGRRPVGMVLTGMTHSDAGRRRLLAARIPVVETWDLAPQPIDMAVGFDHDAIGVAVFRHFNERGRRHFALVSGDDERARRRARGFLRAAKKAMPGADITIHWVPAPTTLSSGREGLALLLSRRSRLDAVFCSSDLVALGVLTEAHQRGIRVPDDLAVVGFGDLQFAAGVVPALTTVRVDGARIGRIAAQLIIDAASGREIAEPIIDVGFSLVVRQSSP
jgi:LacI family gluconate utilization system Gnt-I transcriptional repressor